MVNYSASQVLRGRDQVEGLLGSGMEVEGSPAWSMLTEGADGT
jgi:hypothetical protein